MREDFPNGSFYHDDCFDVTRTLPDQSVDMVLCDLPYGTTQNKWDSALPLDELWHEYWRVAKANAVVVLTASQPFTSVLVASQLPLFRHEWIWMKNRGSNFANTVREPMKEHESVLVFSRGGWTYNKQMQERTGGGLSRVAYAFSAETKTPNYGKIGPPTERQGELRVPSSWQKFNCEVGLHPTQKPVALFEYLIRTYTDEGMTVLDNTAGSGTTAIAAENCNRKWICIDSDESYYATAIERVQKHYEAQF